MSLEIVSWRVLSKAQRVGGASEDGVEFVVVVVVVVGGGKGVVQWNDEGESAVVLSLQVRVE